VAGDGFFAAEAVTVINFEQELTLAKEKFHRGEMLAFGMRTPLDAACR
jgi:hypothetical protein